MLLAPPPTEPRRFVKSPNLSAFGPKFPISGNGQRPLCSLPPSFWPSVRSHLVNSALCSGSASGRNGSGNSACLFFVARSPTSRIDLPSGKRASKGGGGSLSRGRDHSTQKFLCVAQSTHANCVSGSSSESGTTF